MSESFQNLLNIVRSIGTLISIESVLRWDQETYMPKGSIQSRSNQIKLLSCIIQDFYKSPQLIESLETFLNLETGEIYNDSLESSQKRLLKEIYRDWKIANSLPTEFVAEFAQLKSESQYYWEEAYNKNDYSIFKPYLERIISFSKQKAQFINPDISPYDVLLDLYEPGMTQSQLDPIFKDLKSQILDIFSKISNLKSIDTINFSNSSFDLGKQQELSIQLLNKIGFNFNCGRIDLSTHPFTTDFHPTDVRLTTRFKSNDLLEGFTSTLHEGGHALYEQGIDQQWYGTPFGRYCSLGVHESQSRLWENHIGKSKSFWQGHYQKIQGLFPDQLGDYNVDHFYQSINHVKAQPIRVQSDEITYNLHVLIRYEIEKKIINESISVDDLPDLWNQTYHDYLGITPDSLKEGLLQDVHWASGLFGYFPTYTLGNIYGAIIFEKASEEIQSLDKNIQDGDFTLLRQWLQTNIHSVGRQKRSLELIESIQGEPVNISPFINYLKNKYSDIYNSAL
ncbi:carboxypeptidase [Candidatus Marinamargulisbacteria bacterium SCGC AG-410-N11]|nr:carboxypeptidase [Candidatus Marinamargulisbacteria bacterium SCGC AG-410-N11]